MLLLGGALLAVAWILQQIIDIASGDSVAPLVRMCWLCLGVLVSVTTIYVVQCYTYPAFLRRAMKQYKEYAFTELTKKSISTFSDENTSRYISALTNDAVCIETNYLAKIFTLLTKSVSFVGGLVMMLLYSPLLTGFALLLSLVPLAVSVLCGNRLARMETEVSRQNESFVAMTKDLLSGFSVVKSFKAEAEVVARFCRRNEELEETKGRRRRMEEVITMLGTGAGIVAQLGVFLFGAYLAVTKQGVTPGVVIVFLPLMSFVVDPIGSVPPILANRRVQAGQTIRFALPADGPGVEPQPEIPVRVVYEDAFAVVLEKPPHLAVHPTLNYPRDTLANGYAAWAAAHGESPVFRPVNRIDKDTSGLVLAAKNGYAAPLLAEGVEKLYYAIVEGELPLGPGVIDAPIGRRGDSIIGRCVTPEGKPSRTEYTILRAAQGLSLAACVPVTGRTHQIRVHFASIGHPLAGDDLYGGHRDRIARQALHCARQSFRVPAYTEVPGGIRLETPVGEHARTVAVESPLPEDMRALLDAEI